MRTILRPARRGLRRARLELEVRAVRRRPGGRLALFHDYAPPPSGGGNQFLAALAGELERRGVTIERNAIAADTRACLFNSFNFDMRRLERFARDGVRMVHRVDGPIKVYRGFDDGTDDRIAAVNRLAHATVFQSRYSLEKHRDLGYELREPHVVANAVDPRIFNAEGRAWFAGGRPFRLIATSWSDNPNKGGAVYRRLAETLDRDRFDFTFVGRASEAVPGALPPVPSGELAGLLRGADGFVFASEHEACPNAVLEALACGLPVVYAASGGTPEIVGEAGFGFTHAEELPELLDRLVREHERLRRAITVPSLADVADRYLEILRLDA